MSSPQVIALIPLSLPGTRYSDKYEYSSTKNHNPFNKGIAVIFIILFSSLPTIAQ